uniref:Uncharacterized protein n=1 Tax=Meloidogyne enterolobii TaxID=390850 RepID=A0A6V7XQG0_MELEN|nr:unnamed protein product [Meloidogyne enterolobii]
MITRSYGNFKFSNKFYHQDKTVWGNRLILGSKIQICKCLFIRMIYLRMIYQIYFFLNPEFSEQENYCLQYQFFLFSFCAKIFILKVRL